LRVRRLEDADVEPIAAMLARAFYDDPVQRWALPDDGARLGVLERLFTLQIRHGSLPLGQSWCTDDLRCAANWAPPGRWRPDRSVMRAMAPMPEIVGGRLQALRVVHELMTGPHPDDPHHWYLQGVGTDPDVQGRGYASATLAPVLRRADREGVPAYLEATKARNVAIYEHLGFVVRDELALPDGGPKIWTMWRAPRAGTTE
jgi:GNAT superfamily N-acetyltransferase